LVSGIFTVASKAPDTVSDPGVLVDDGFAPGEAALWYDGEIDVRLVQIDNSLNTVAVYLKLFEATDAATVTLGTTPPDAQFMCPATSTITYTVSTAEGESALYFTGVVYVTLTTAGTAGAGGDTGEGLPAANPTIKMLGLRA
jgi:hypothetical protein